MTAVSDCPACSAPSVGRTLRLDPARRERFVEFDRRKFGGLLTSWLNEFEVEVSICHACGHAWYRNQPSAAQLQAMYSAAKPMFVREAELSREPTAEMRRLMVCLHHLVDARADASTLLDYGSGFGRWARAAVAAGFVVTAFEPSYARAAEVGVPFELVYSTEQLRGRRFDVLQLEQVLEHVPDPFRTLHSLHEFCHPHTVIRVSVPNIVRANEGDRIWDLWPFDGRVPHILAPFEHLHGFTPRSLRTLCSRAGYKVDWSIRVWRTDLFGQLRRLGGHFVPQLGTTSLLLRSTRAASPAS